MVLLSSHSKQLPILLYRGTTDQLSSPVLQTDNFTRIGYVSSCCNCTFPQPPFSSTNIIFFIFWHRLYHSSYQVEFNLMGRICSQMEQTRPCLSIETCICSNYHEISCIKNHCYVTHIFAECLRARTCHGGCDTQV